MVQNETCNKKFSFLEEKIYDLAVEVWKHRKKLEYHSIKKTKYEQKISLVVGRKFNQRIFPS